MPITVPALPHARTVLLLVDLINPLQFDGAEHLAGPAVQAATAVAALKRDAAARGVPAIYVNDNFGRWHSDFRALLTECRRQGGAAARLVQLLAPRADDFTVLKPRHSGFLGTPLAWLLRNMNTRRVVITGLATDLCVQFTAMDAFLRGLQLWVPADCAAAESVQRHQAALAWMARALKCETRPAWPAGTA